MCISGIRVMIRRSRVPSWIAGHRGWSAVHRKIALEMMQTLKKPMRSEVNDERRALR